METRLAINPRRILFILVVAGILILLLSLWGIHMRFSPYDVSNNAQANFIEDFSTEMDFKLQHNVSAYFGMLVMALAAYLLFAVKKLKVKATGRWFWEAMFWFVLFLSMDNLAEILIRINTYLPGAEDVKVPFPTSQVVVAVLFLMLLILFWQRLDSSSRWLFLAFALTYFGGTIFKELIRSAKDLTSAFYIFAAQILEYGGEITLVYGVLRHLEVSLPKFFVFIAGVETSKK